jgi:hypothetical protein
MEYGYNTDERHPQEIASTSHTDECLGCSMRSSSVVIASYPAYRVAADPCSKKSLRAGSKRDAPLFGNRRDYVGHIVVDHDLEQSLRAVTVGRGVPTNELTYLWAQFEPLALLAVNAELWIERTLFTVDWLESPELRRRCQAGPQQGRGPAFSGACDTCAPAGSDHRPHDREPELSRLRSQSGHRGDRVLRLGRPGRSYRQDLPLVSRRQFAARWSQVSRGDKGALRLAARLRLPGMCISPRMLVNIG